jgi:cytolysin-activating lysine-acyltransferase
MSEQAVLEDQPDMTDPEDKAENAPVDANSEAGPETESAEDARPQGVPGAKPPTLSELLGEITFMLSTSPAHRLMFLADLNWLVVPPVRLNQFRLVRKAGRAIAYVSWALVNEEVEQRLTAGAKRLKPDEWQCGDTPFIIDLVAPLGNGDEIIEGLKKSVFEG